MARDKYLVFVSKSEKHAAFVDKDGLDVGERCQVVDSGMTKKDAKQLATDIRHGKIVID